MSCCFKTNVKVIGEGLTASLSTEKILSAKVSSLSAPLVASINDVSKRLQTSVMVVCSCDE